MLDFDHEELDEFISVLDDMIDDLYEELEKCEIAKEDVTEIAKGKAIDKYSEYTTDIDDYQATIDLYEAIRDDLQEFYDRIDDKAFYNTESKFYYDSDLKGEIKEIVNKTDDLEHDCKINIGNKEYTPFGFFDRGNFLHKGSPEEELIDSNDGKMEDFALEINKGITKLIESSEEIEDKFKEHFKDIEDDGDYSKYHEDYDGLSEEHHEWVKGALIVGGAALTVAVFATGVGEAATLGIVAEGSIGASEAVEGAGVVEGVEVAETVEVTEGVEVAGTVEEEEVVENPISNSTKQHMKKHTFEGMEEQSKCLTDEQLERKLKKNTFFNKALSTEQIYEYTEEAYEEVKMYGKGSYPTQVNGEDITIVIGDNGNLQSAYGNYHYSVSDFR